MFQQPIHLGFAILMGTLSKIAEAKSRMPSSFVKPPVSTTPAPILFFNHFQVFLPKSLTSLPRYHDDV